jgi:hypothetical protein
MRLYAKESLKFATEIRQLNRLWLRLIVAGFIFIPVMCQCLHLRELASVERSVRTSSKMSSVLLDSNVATATTVEHRLKADAECPRILHIERTRVAGLGHQISEMLVFPSLKFSAKLNSTFNKVRLCQVEPRGKLFRDKRSFWASCHFQQVRSDVFLT